MNVQKLSNKFGKVEGLQELGKNNVFHNQF